MKRLIIGIVALVAIVACADDDHFSTNRNNTLTFSADTLKMDTVFSKVPSATYSFWVFNNSSDGIRLSSVRLLNGNQTGFRVNVDGSYLDNDLGSVLNGLELRKDDSLRVFVEITAPENGMLQPQVVADYLVFQLESGVEQRVRLQAHAWDAIKLTNPVFFTDTTIESQKPIVIYGNGIRVDSNATLTMRNTTLFFHDGAGIDVYGTLKTENCVLRGDRLDRMFDYLPYDRVSGQWRGLTFASSSFGNSLTDTQIRNAMTAVTIGDSTLVDTLRTAIELTRCVIHNAKGHGVLSTNAKTVLRYCQLTNTLGDCLLVKGGICNVDHCTFAQFYPFSADRGAALRFIGTGDVRVNCENSILTGYSEDVLMGVRTDTTSVFEYAFTDCLLRTPKVEDDTLNFRNIIWESPDDSIQGKKHFKVIDEENLYYDFHLDTLSTAQGKGCY